MACIREAEIAQRHGRGTWRVPVAGADDLSAIGFAIIQVSTIAQHNFQAPISSC